MPPWLYVWMSRFGRGERLEKAKPSDYRLWFGILFLTPVLLAAFEKIPKTLFEGSLWIVWLVGTVFGLISLAAAIAWGRFVPATVSLVLAVIAWVAFFLYSPFK